MRTLLHGIFHSLLLNSTSRLLVLNYLAEILQKNSKRTQINADDKLLARDGFMINVLSVLQLLSVKIKLNRVNPMYPFYSCSMVSIEDDTKLRYSSKQYIEMITKIGEF